MQVNFAWGGPDCLFPTASQQLGGLHRAFDMFEAVATFKQERTATAFATQLSLKTQFQGFSRTCVHACVRCMWGGMLVVLRLTLKTDIVL